MFVSFKKYGKIGVGHLLDIKVLKNDKDLIYEGSIDDAPEEIRNMHYYKVTILDNITTYYVYTDDYLATLDIEALNKRD